ncbi:MFS transporter [Salimicrobium jeotgali]|uniref:MFS transporter n=2 Tax=Salimicrobium TaxID=351195 RepID=K2GBU1_9BACI|nr:MULTISPECIES: MFS transporter [Salimicrobium]AKG05117.1 MFS transporter [Salimicrobium jeotgali]EKE32513.1 MFS-type transporter [Salimicrobium jeotgali]MBM7695504.1 MFS family permease [Salimicrobium jeotgali]SIS77776.1 Predicted arabinose efflux permease, MFS family [Salimicrobium salexigens]
MFSVKQRFRVLIGLVTISGFSQGMLLPLLAVILEQNGVSSSLNGIHATGLYIGILLASPFIEKPLRSLGFKPIIMVGGLLVVTSLFLFPFWQSLWFWFALRVAIGIGDQILHFGTQTWITTTADKGSRGRSIAYYGLFFSLGFTLGPLMTNLLSVSTYFPFLLASFLSLGVWLFMLKVGNEFPEEDYASAHGSSSFRRFLKAAAIAWPAFLGPLCYGFLEASLHGIFPVYGLRIGHNVQTVSFIIPAFAAASLLSQIPLGRWSDSIGRPRVIRYALAGGTAAFLIASFYESSATVLFLCFAFAGLCVGSLFSLGISYMTDLLPRELLPAGNILCGMSFSIGSILGPFLSGIVLDILPGLSLFFLIVGLLVFIFLVFFFKKDVSVTQDPV